MVEILLGNQKQQSLWMFLMSATIHPNFWDLFISKKSQKTKQRYGIVLLLTSEFVVRLLLTDSFNKCHQMAIPVVSLINRFDCARWSRASNKLYVYTVRRKKRIGFTYFKVFKGNWGFHGSVHLKTRHLKMTLAHSISLFMNQSKAS